MTTREVCTRTRMLSCMSTDTDTSKSILYRATQDFEVSGRTIEGLALPWEQWQVVRDLRGPTYPESHMRSAFDESLRRDPGVRPLYSMHEYAFDPTADPIGVAHFMPAAEALMFRGFLSKTRKADEQLELIKDGAKRAVSVGFEPLKTRNVQRPEGLGRLRVESKLRELSVAPTGFGQYPESRILAMRSRPRRSVPTALDRLNELNERRRALGRSALPPEFVRMSSEERMRFMEEHG